MNVLQDFLHPDVFSTASLIAFGQVILIDLMLAGDNAVVIGMAAARVPSDMRRKVILWGLGVAVGLRVVLALVAVSLMKVIGLTLAGGILLLWVAWRFWREISESHGDQGKAPPKPVPVRRAILQIVLADVSMSLDNVLGVAGAARDHVYVLIAGLVLSVALMGVASEFLARLLGRWRWISYVGLLVVVYVAGSMIWEGGNKVFDAVT